MASNPGGRYSGRAGSNNYSYPQYSSGRHSESREISRLSSSSISPRNSSISNRSTLSSPPLSMRDVRNNILNRIDDERLRNGYYPNSYEIDESDNDDNSNDRYELSDQEDIIDLSSPFTYQVDDEPSSYSRIRTAYFDSLPSEFSQLNTGSREPCTCDTCLGIAPADSSSSFMSLPGTMSYSSPGLLSARTPSYSTSISQLSSSSRNTVQPRMTASTNYCAMRDDCQTPQDRNLITVNTSPVHKTCLISYIGDQIFSENAEPNKIESINGYGPAINWSQIVNAIHGTQASQTEALTDLNPIVTLFLGQANMVDNFKRSDPQGFVEFAFDAARALGRDEKIDTGSTKLTKLLLLQMALDTALSCRTYTSLPKISRLITDITDETRFVVQGRTTDRDTLTDWANGRNLPRGANRTPDARQNRNAQNDAQVEGVMRGQNGSWGRTENSMERAIIQNNIDRFAHITAGYRPAGISSSRVFDIVKTEITSYVARLNASQRNARSGSSRNQSSRTQSSRTTSRTIPSRNRRSNQTSNRNSATNTTNITSTAAQQSPAPSFEPWTNRDRMRRVETGLERARTENERVGSYNNESQQSTLVKLMGYINSPEHSAKKKDDLMSATCYAFEDLGTRNPNGYSHVIECAYGQIGRIMQIPQKIDERDLDTEDLPPEEGTMDNAALNEMLRTDMANHVEKDELTVQIQLLMQDCAPNDPDEDPDVKGLFKLLRDMFIENMEGKYCIGNTSASKQQVIDRINIIWPQEGLDPSSLIQPLS